MIVVGSMKLGGVVSGLFFSACDSDTVCCSNRGSWVGLPTIFSGEGGWLGARYSEISISRPVYRCNRKPNEEHGGH